MKEIEIWKTRLVSDDILGEMDPELREGFLKLPEDVQESLIEEYKDSIAKGLQAGIMYDWSYIMRQCMDESGLIADIECRVGHECAICGREVCLERHNEEMPPEYNVCDACDAHVCDACTVWDDDGTPICKKCGEEEMQSRMEL